jgi:hypothetical protein
MMGEGRTRKGFEGRALATIEALSQDLPGGADGNHESPQSLSLTSRPKYELILPEYKSRGLPYTNQFSRLLVGHRWTFIKFCCSECGKKSDKSVGGDEWAEYLSSQPCYLMSHSYFVYWRSRVTASVYESTILAVFLGFIQPLQTHSMTLPQIRTQPLRFKSLPIHYSLMFCSLMLWSKLLVTSLIIHRWVITITLGIKIALTVRRNAYKLLAVSFVY